MVRGLYPKDWDVISEQVKWDAHFTCSECGRQCRLPGEPFDSHERTLTTATSTISRGTAVGKTSRRSVLRATFGTMRAPTSENAGFRSGLTEESATSAGSSTCSCRGSPLAG